MLSEVVQPYGEEYRTTGGEVFGLRESSMRSYAPFNGLVLYAFIRHFRPRKVVEVGSGMSTRIMSRAFAQNARDGLQGDYVVIDPYVSAELKRSCEGTTQFIDRPIEEMPTDRFLELGENDVLFVDSSHTVRVFGDVNYLFLTLFPQLQPGVLVHVHDIFFPRDYLPHHFLGGKQKQIWQEQYLLQAFLMFNEAFRVELCASYLHLKHLQELSAVFPWYHKDRCPSSFWMRRIAAT
jgi:predicted O-methyltransferase YrrM